MKVTVVGLGYVGMANAVLLSKHHDVTAYDIDPVKVQLVRDRQSPIADELIEAALATGSARLSATTDPSRLTAMPRLSSSRPRRTTTPTPTTLTPHPLSLSSPTSSRLPRTRSSW